MLVNQNEKNGDRLKLIFLLCDKHGFAYVHNINMFIKINKAYCDKFLRNTPRNLIWNNNNITGIDLY